MTRDEFIDGYIQRSGIADEVERTPEGFKLKANGWASVALPCACGEEGCQGWAMISDDPELIADHKRFRGPPDQ